MIIFRMSELEMDLNGGEREWMRYFLILFTTWKFAPQSQ